MNLGDFPDCPEVVEDGDTFTANAQKKAVEVARFTGCHALADDSGLVVDALQGEPGIYSARYAGEQATDKDNLDKVLQNLDGITDSQRTARFQCVIALATPAGDVTSFAGTVEGKINLEPRGDNGFGYDPVFIPRGFDRTFAQMDPGQKDRLSHRGRALQAFSKGWKKT